MQKLVSDYLNELNSKQKKRRKAGMATLLLVVLVVSAVIGTLTQYGVAMTGNVKCGLEEHQHSADCYSETLTCGQEESAGHTHTEECALPAELVCGLEESEGQDGVEDHLHSEECYAVPEGWECGQEESAGHTHTDACYTSDLSCGMEEHIHTDACYIDKQADVEKAEDWDAQYADVEWTNNWGEDLVKAATMQVGYEESRDNYEVAEDGSHNGYTRYGQFAGEPYADNWDAAFVNFCLHYAGLEESNLFPETTDSEKWQEEFNKIEEENSSYLAKAADYTPEPGDIVFLNQENEETPVQMGIVSDYDQTSGEVSVVQGDSDGSVKENRYKAEETENAEYLEIGEVEAAVRTEEPSAPVAEELTEGQDNTASDDTGDTYVTDFNVIGIIDGSEPFDEKPTVGELEAGINAATDGKAKTELEKKLSQLTEDGYIHGDDENASNRIVRTFDTLQYEFRVDMASRDETQEYKDASIRLKFVLPVSKEQADFDTDAMSWLKPLEGNKLTSKEVGQQVVVEGKVNLHSDTRNVVPGSYGNTVTIKINNMKNKEKLNPTFTAYMEGNTAMTDIQAGEVTVSAAQKYNVYVDGMNSYTGVFDFRSGVNGAANKDRGRFKGKAVKVGVAIQLYNDSPTKGLKGIELPNENQSISFDLEINSKYGKNGVEAGEVGESYRPLLWSFEGSQERGKGVQDQYGRVVDDLEWSRRMVPDNSGDAENACYNGGTWKAEQSGNRVNVTIEGWKIDPEKMPKKNGIGDDTLYDANVGCFSAGEFVFVQPFTKEDQENVSPYDIIADSGFGISELLLYMDIKVVDGKLTIGQTPYYSKMNHEVKKNFGLTLPGVLRNEVAYLKHGEKWLSPGYDEERYPNGYNGHGDSYALTGETIDLAAGVTFMPGDYGRMCWATNLLKFDSGMLELTGNYHSNFGNESHNRATLDNKGMIPNVNTRVYYATKEDGTAWNSRDEMKTTYEDKLIFYPRLNDIPENAVCVGILTCFKGKGTAEPIEAMYQVAHEARVLRMKEYTKDKEDKDNIGKTCVMVSTSRAWPEKANNGTVIDSFPDFPDSAFSGIPTGLPTEHMRNANTPGYGSVRYEWENGSSKPQFVGDGKAYLGDYFLNSDPDILAEELGNIWNTATAWNDKKLEYCFKAIDGLPEWAGLYDAYGSPVGQFYKETEYSCDDNGLVQIKRQHNSVDMNTGDTLLIIGYKAKVAKSSVQTAVGDDGKKNVKKTFNLNEDQRVVDYKVEPQIEYKAGVGKAKEEKTTVTIVDTLPANTEYIDGSTYIGGEYLQTSPEGGEQGNIIGGTCMGKEDGSTPLTKTIPDTKKPGDPGYFGDIKVTQQKKIVDGRWVLIWTFEDMPVTRPMESIYYSVKIKDEVVKLGSSGNVPMENTVYITSTDDKRVIKNENGNQAVWEVKAEYANQDSLGKTVNKSIVESNENIKYTVYYNNFSMNRYQGVLLVDTMPKNGVKVGTEEEYESNFDGGYKVTGWRLDKGNVGKIKIYYPTDEKTDTNITQAMVADSSWTWNGWTEAEVSAEGEIKFNKDSFPLVWVAYGDVNSGESIHVTLDIQLDLGNPKSVNSDKTNHLVNVISGKSNGEDKRKYVTTDTVRRILEGLAWVDYNHNGLRDEGEEPLSNVKVQLWEWDEENEQYIQSCYEGTETPIEIKTGKQVSIRAKNIEGNDYEKRTDETVEDTNGCYRFMDLSNKKYAVRFIDPSGTEIQYEATKANVGDDDTIDSDGVLGKEPDEDGNVFTQISDLKMPSTLEIQKIGEGAIYRSEHNDSGFYPKSELQIQKTGKDGKKKLKGAIFTISEITNSEESAVSFRKEEDGKYTMLDPEGQFVLSEKEEILIARADKRHIVMNVNGSAVEAVEESKSNIDTRRFKIYDVEDGYKAVKYVNGGWMALDDLGNVEIQSPMNDSEEPPTDKKFHWEFKKWQNGEYSIIPREKPESFAGECFVGMDGNSVGLSNGTDGMKYNFLLIPAARYGETTDLEVMDTGALEIKNLRSNTSYLIKEIKSPDGYRVLSENERVVIHVNEKGEVTLTETGGGMVSVIKDSTSDDGDMNGGKTILKLNIRNNKLYELPSAGGMGIYWYSIGGMLLMLAAALILYKNKCKEVLES